MGQKVDQRRLLRSFSLPRSAPWQGGIQRRLQFLLTERLEQAGYRALRDELPAQALIGTSGDENNRNRLAAHAQLVLQLRSGHAGHGDIQYQATRRRDAAGPQKFVRRGERLRCESELAQQVRKRFADRLIIVDDGYDQRCGDYLDARGLLGSWGHEMQDAPVGSQAP